MKTQRLPLKSAGFTLIEMMIAMAILTFIAIGIYEATSRTFEMRDRLSAAGDYHNSVRAALDQVRRDIIMIYTPQLRALPTQLGQIQTSDTGAPQGSGAGQPQPPTPAPNASQEPFDPGQASAYWGQKLNRFNIRPSRLQGEAEKISFISNTHVRLYRDSLESDFVKIQYTVEEDSLAGSGRKALVRYEDPQVFVDEGRTSETQVRVALLSGVRSLKFRYLDGEKDQWLDRWDTDNAYTKNKFPTLIELTVEVNPPAPLPATEILAIKQVYRPELAL